MRALRASPLSVLAFSSALQAFILFCWVSGLLLRQVFMKALRSSPFLSAASALQVAMRVCCLVGAAADAAGAADVAGVAAVAGAAALAPAAGASAAWAALNERTRLRAVRERSLFIGAPVECGI